MVLAFIAKSKFKLQVFEKKVEEKTFLFIQIQIRRKESINHYKQLRKNYLINFLKQLRQ